MTSDFSPLASAEIHKKSLRDAETAPSGLESRTFSSLLFGRPDAVSTWRPPSAPSLAAYGICQGNLDNSRRLTQRRDRALTTCARAPASPA